MKQQGDFKKQQKKHKNIQHNRDQLKLLKEEKIAQADLFVLDPDGFKKVTIMPLTNAIGYSNVVFLSRKGRLLTGTVMKDEYDDSRVNIVEEGYVAREYVFGHIINIEMLKGKERAT